MKKTKLIFALLCFIGITAFAQTDNNTITGKITDVRSYNDEYAMTVGNTTLVLIINLNGKSGRTFEINKGYENLLVKSKGTYKLNPKYSDKTFKIEYYVNGKGWKCIKTIQPSGK